MQQVITWATVDRGLGRHISLCHYAKKLSISVVHVRKKSVCVLQHSIHSFSWTWSPVILTTSLLLHWTDQVKIDVKETMHMGFCFSERYHSKWGYDLARYRGIWKLMKDSTRGVIVIRHCMNYFTASLQRPNDRQITFTGLFKAEGIPLLVPWAQHAM